MSDIERPVMLVDLYMDDKIEHDDLPLAEYMGHKCFPHCDPRVLHSPEDCQYCGKQTELQEERVRLDVSNTGKTNRRWICPADRDRPATNQIWPGNRPEGYSALFRPFSGSIDVIDVGRDDDEV